MVFVISPSHLFQQIILGSIYLRFSHRMLASKAHNRSKILYFVYFSEVEADEIHSSVQEKCENVKMCIEFLLMLDLLF